MPTILKLFESRAEKLIDKKLENIKMNGILKGIIHGRIESDTQLNWKNRLKILDEAITKRFDKINFDKYIEKEFKQEVLEELWSKLRLVK